MSHTADEQWRSELQYKARKERFTIQTLEAAHDATVSLLEYTEAELAKLHKPVRLTALIVTAVRHSKER